VNAAAAAGSPRALGRDDEQLEAFDGGMQQSRGRGWSEVGQLLTPSFVNTFARWYSTVLAEQQLGPGALHRSSVRGHPGPPRDVEVAADPRVSA
jgi:hypothetical protein